MTQKKEKQKLFNLIICVNFESLRRNALKQTDKVYMMHMHVGELVGFSVYDKHCKIDEVGD